MFLVSSLTSAGFSVTATNSFSSARALLMAQPPAVLVTEIRLGSYNGLHLALLGRSSRPHMAVIVTSRFHDPVLQRDAEAWDATFVRKPMTAPELLAALYRSARRGPNACDTAELTRPPHASRPRRERRRDIATFLFLEASRR